MQNTFKDTLLSILDIIEYQKDKDAYVKKFQETVTMSALFTLLASLPAEEEKVLKERLMTEKEPEVTGRLLNERFSKEDADKALNKATGEVLNKFMKDVIPTLRKDQIEKLKNYLNKIKDVGPQKESTEISS